MDIAILGSGNVGGALASLWAAKGHRVTIGLRDGSTSRTVLPPGVRTAPVATAVAGASAVLLAVPWPAAEAAVRAAGPWAGKVLIDATNPLLPDLSGLAVGTTTSAGEQVAGWAAGARVVKAFNTIGAHLFGHADFPPAGLASGFLCGDDADAKRSVAALVADAGLDPLDVGPLTMARYLEPMAGLWVDLAVRQQMAGAFGFKLVRRTGG